MKFTILGSGGCMVIPKPLCQCHVCQEARKKGIPYSRAGPSTFLHDINLLIDTPADIVNLLNRSAINKLEYIILTHLDPDHVEGLRVVEQTTIDFRTWYAYPEKQINLLIPIQLIERIKDLRSQYGSVIEYYQEHGFIKIQPFNTSTIVEDVKITAIPINRIYQTSFIYVFEKKGNKVVYAPCDLKPFPENLEEVQKADLLITQPGLFEDGLKQKYVYPVDHISRKTLYTYNQTIQLAKRLNAKQILFVHLEEYWNRNYDDYKVLERQHNNVLFSYDCMEILV